MAAAETPSVNEVCKLDVPVPGSSTSGGGIGGACSTMVGGGGGSGYAEAGEPLSANPAAESDTTIPIRFTKR